MFIVRLLIVFLFFSNIFLQECPPSDTLAISPIQNNWDIPNLNDWNNLDIMTWNIKQFPLSNNTVEDVSEIISDILPDIILFQEINDLNQFNYLSSILPAYEFINSGDDLYGLGMAFRKDCIDLINYSTLFSANGYEFAWRYPLKANLIWNCGNSYLSFEIINVHFKCCNDGFQRRLDASEILVNYLDNQINSGLQNNIIVGGDFNDEITDSNNQNSLLPLVNSNNIYFVTTPLVNDDYYNSFPSYPSFLDHILVSNDLFDSNENSYVNTIRIDDYTGWNYFQNNISDHRPVFWSIQINEIPTGLIINEIMNNPSASNDSFGEWFEITNVSNEVINLNGYTIKDNGIDEHIINSDLYVSPNEFIVLGISSDTLLNAGIDIDYQYDNFNLSNFGDELILLHPYGAIMDKVEYDYDGQFPNYEGSSMALESTDTDNNLGLNWVASQIIMENGDFGSPGEENIQSCELNYDNNNDGEVNILDVISIVNHVVGIALLDNDCTVDFNMDGNINVIDIVYIVTYIIGE